MRPVRLAGVVAAVLMAAACGTPPVPTASPAVPRSAGAASLSAPSPGPTLSSSPGLVPPDAALLAGGGDPVTGQLGSYVWRETGSDAPWLPGSPVTVELGRPMRFGLSFEVPVADWSARYALPGEPSPDQPVRLANGSAPLEVAPPPAGTWSVALTVQFGQGLGSATWYWRVEVP